MASSLRKHRKVLRLICSGMFLNHAAHETGMSWNGVRHVYRRYGGPPLQVGRSRGSLATTPDFTRPAGPHRGLSYTERVRIMIGLDFGVSKAEMARRIGRHRSIITRELARNTGPNGDYNADIAHAWAAHRARRPRTFKLKDHPLCRQISDWIEDGWSPKLISRMLKFMYPDDPSRQVSHETIYQCLYVQTRGSLRADLARRLSTRRTKRKPRNRVERRGKPYEDAFKISERPAEAADRAVPGYWEGDLIVGAKCGSAIGTLVERATRFTILLHLPDDHGADAVASAMITAMSELPEHLRRTVTWDRGVEMASHERIRMALGSPVYFCDPHKPWQRGTNENTNRLLRHWFEKGTDLSVHDAAELKRVQDLAVSTRGSNRLGQ
ncbi:IS30 family transposase [Tomitella sp. HY188]|uniref:IS30 family transposase n=1 Tax=Tomitella fengzijianii TaxID=2597660 RepID=A0A516X285_9ACTN|nr:IS30 family transposase [Tomitella fengzijianii]